MTYVEKLIMQSSKNPYRIKDAEKFRNITKFIGRGSKNSSTAKYANALKKIANVHLYSLHDVVGISVEGISVEGNRSGRLKFDGTEIVRALEAGATIVTDKPTDRIRPYNAGERELEKFLKKHDYYETFSGNWEKRDILCDFDSEHETVHGLYIGKKKRLKGCVALLHGYLFDEKLCMAQFNHYTVPEAFGWHKFNRSDFEVEREL